MADYSELKRKAQEIRDEVKAGANTASRVGLALEETVKALEAENKRAEQVEVNLGNTVQLLQDEIEDLPSMRDTIDRLGTEKQNKLNNYQEDPGNGAVEIFAQDTASMTVGAHEGSACVEVYNEDDMPGVRMSVDKENGDSASVTVWGNEVHIEGDAVKVNGVELRADLGDKLTELESKVSVEVETKLNIGESDVVNKNNVFLLDGYVNGSGNVIITNDFKHATIFTNNIQTISFTHTTGTVSVPTVLCRDRNGTIIDYYQDSGEYNIPLTTTRVDLNFFGEGFADEFTIVANSKNETYEDVTATNATYYDITGKEYSSEAFKSTNLIPVVEGQKIQYKAGTQTSGFATILAYNKDKEVISYLESIQGEVQRGEYVVPKGCSYIRVTYYYQITDAFIRIELTSALRALIASDGEDKQMKMIISDFPLVGYIKGDGSFASMGGMHSTDYVNIQGYNQMEVITSINNLGYCVFYFADKTVCSTFQANGIRKIIDIPNGSVYVRLCNIDADVTTPSAILRKVSNHWQNRKIAIYGTSIEAGYPLSSFENNRERVNTYSFMSAAIEQIGAIPLNYAVPSGFICKKANHTQSFLGSTASDIDYGPTGIRNVNINNRLLNYIGTENDADAYLFAYHVNDSLEDDALLDNSEVDYGSLDETTFVGAYNATMKAIFTAKPNAVVMIASHYTNDGFSNQEPRRYKRVNTILKGIADYWNIPFIDLASSGIIINNGIINNYATYMTDAGHPAAYNKAEGLELITRVTERVRAALLSI